MKTVKQSLDQQSARVEFRRLVDQLVVMNSMAILSIFNAAIAAPLDQEAAKTAQKHCQELDKVAQEIIVTMERL